MDDTKYLKTYDDFLQQHPEVDPADRAFMEPVIQGADDSIYSFIISYIFM